MNLQKLKIKNDLIIFTVGATAYPILELLWRGHTHISMAIAGGLSLALINRFCCEKYCKKAMYLRCALGSLIITSIELVIGLIVNKFLFLNVWDYSNLPFNMLGQICLPFSLAWFFLCIPAMYICKTFTKFMQKKPLE